MSRLTGVGLAIVAAAIAAMLILGATSVGRRSSSFGGGDHLGAFGFVSYECGSVFIREIPRDQQCDEDIADRRNILMFVGIPGVVGGLVIAAAGIREKRRREG